MKEILLINPENVTLEKAESYAVRKAARAIVIDKNNKIALLNVRKNNYYKLPGGGLEGDEDPKLAVKRECIEEIGSDINIINEVGIITEYRKFSKLNQISYCYIARVVGDLKPTQMTEDEIENDFHQTWLSYEEAITAITSTKSKDIEGEYIIARDTKFLKQAGIILGF